MNGDQGGWSVEGTFLFSETTNTAQETIWALCGEGIRDKYWQVIIDGTQLHSRSIALIESI